MGMIICTYTDRLCCVLEVVDREGKLSYIQKLILRSNMARAVANTYGYEAYDRTDIDMIMSEHDFQQTGLVREDEIRRLGEMTGVSLILVTEAVKADYNNLFVTAKILNVESAKVEISDNLSMGSGMENIERECKQLATKLFGVTSNISQTERYKVNQVSRKEYEYMAKYMNRKQYGYFLRNNCAEAYRQYRKGKAMCAGGWTLFSFGLAGTGMGIMLCCMGDAVGAGGALIAVGGLMTGGGITLFTIDL